MRGSEILANPDEGVKYLAGELASRLPHLSGNEAHALALAEMARRGIEPSWAAKCTARVAAKSAARTRNARLVREDVERESQEQPVETWRPLDLSQPSAWAGGVVPAEVQKAYRQLATVDFDANAEFPPPSWLAKGLLPRRGIGLLFGESGAGKSFAAIHAALSVAWGIPLFGSRTKQGGVLYIAAEGGSSVLPRIRAANDAMQAQLAHNASRAPLRVVTEAPDLSRDGDPRPLVRTIESAARDFEAAGHRLAMVIVDTYHAAMGGAEENSAADAGAALKPLRDAAEGGDFLCLIIHHPGKDTERGARGSNALPAAADAIIAVTVPGFEGAKAKPSTAARQATVTKMRDGEAGGGFNYRLPVVRLGVDEDGDPWTTCIVEPCEAAVELRSGGLNAADREFMCVVNAAIGEAQGERTKVEEVRLRFYAGRPDAKDDARRMAWQRAFKRAIEAGRVEVDEQNTFLSLAPAD